MLDSQDRLYEASKACGTFRMSDVRFNLTGRVSLSIESLVGSGSYRCDDNTTITAETFGHCRGLDTITDSSAGAVTLDHCGLGQVRNAGLLVNAAYKSLLRYGTRREHALRATVAVDTGSADDCPDRVTILECLSQPLDLNGVDSLATSIPICGGIECLAHAGRREHALVAQRKHHCRRKDQARATYQGSIAITVSNGFARQI